MVNSTDLLELLPAAVYTTDVQGRITFYNQAAADLWGHRPEIGIAQWCGSWRLYWPDGRPMAHDECPRHFSGTTFRQSPRGDDPAGSPAFPSRD
jgi:PAS domain-containing protein